MLEVMKYLWLWSYTFVYNFFTKWEWFVSTICIAIVIWFFIAFMKYASTSTGTESDYLDM